MTLAPLEAPAFYLDFETFSPVEESIQKRHLDSEFCFSGQFITK